MSWFDFYLWFVTSCGKVFTFCVYSFIYCGYMEIRGELGVLILSFTTWVPGTGMKQETHLPIETFHQPT